MRIINLLKLKFKLKSSRGFVLPFTLLICVIILTISTTISSILTKELYFSKLSRESQTAYYAADNGLMCATSIDDSYIDPDTGLGIFESGAATAAQVLVKVNAERAQQSLDPLTLYGGNNPIKCATSEIFNPDISTIGFNVKPYNRTNSLGDYETGNSSIFTLHMDLGGGAMRCAKITVNKTPNYRQIISQGYAECPGTRVKYPVERAVVSETEVK